MFTPPVGYPVQFFPGGARGNRQPYAGIVTETGADGQVKLSLFPPGGGMVLGNQRFHHHIDDPWVKENAKFLQGADPGTMPRGCWDWVPGMEIQVGTTDDAKEDRRVEGRAKVAEWLAEGIEPEKIANKCRFYGLTKADVEELIGAPA